MKTIPWMLIFCCGLSSIAPAQLKEFQWLIGEWKLENKNTFEVWTVDPVTADLMGKGFTVTGTDTIVNETMTIAYRNNAFHYIPDVAGDQTEVAFRMTSFDTHGFTAENPTHDFPKLIRYRHVQKSGEDYIEAAIEGNGKVTRYSFKRLK